MENLGQEVMGGGMILLISAIGFPLVIRGILGLGKHIPKSRRSIDRSLEAQKEEAPKYATADR